MTSYSLSYSNDTQIWFYYKDANHLEAKVDNSSASQQNFHVSARVVLSSRLTLDVPTVTNREVPRDGTAAYWV